MIVGNNDRIILLAFGILFPRPPWTQALELNNQKFKNHKFILFEVASIEIGHAMKYYLISIVFWAPHLRPLPSPQTQIPH